MSVATARSSDQCDTEQARYRRADSIAWVGTSRVVVLDLSSPGAVPVALEGSGAWLWHQLRRTTSAAALAYRAALEFDVDVEDLIDDVYSFLDRLTSSGLVQRIDDSVSGRWPEP